MKKIICLLVLVLVLGCGRIENQTLGDAEDEDTGGEDVALADVSQSDRSPWDGAVPIGNHAVVVAANWTDPIGSLAVIDLDNPDPANTALVTTDGSDAVITSFDGRLYVINRFGTDTVQVIDPADFSVLGNYSVGSGSNPQDIYVYSEDKAYLTRLDSQNDTENQDDLLVIHPLTGELISSIDLKSYTEDDGDRLARATQMVAVDNNLYVLLQDLPSNLMDPADAPGKIVVIDMRRNNIVGSVVLNGRNPSEITYSPITEKIYVANTGVFNMFVVDTSDPYGGIEVIDPVTLTTEGIVVDDMDLGGYVMGLRLAEDRAYTVTDSYKLASFDITTYEVIETNLYESPGFFVPDIGVDNTGRVLLTEQDMTASGIAILDGETGEVLYEPIDVGATPASITFVDID